MPDGYLKCHGRLRGCPVEILGQRPGFLAVKLLEARGVWEAGDTLTIEPSELSPHFSVGRDSYDDLAYGKRATPKYAVYDYTEDDIIGS